MPRKLRQLRNDLRHAGCYKIRHNKGSHEHWGHGLLSDTLTLAGADNKDAQHYQEEDVRDFLQRVAEAKNQQKGR